MSTPLTMRNRHLLALLGTCYMLAVSAIHFEARAQDAAKSCNSECLLKVIDTLDKKVDALEGMERGPTIVPDARPPPPRLSLKPPID